MAGPLPEAPMDFQTFNDLTPEQSSEAMHRCCSASRWVSRMVADRPYSGLEDLLDKAESHWSDMRESDWLEAFDGHPRIGDPESLKAKYRATLATASGEQASVQTADENTIAGLAEGNAQYFSRFGFIFIIFATGKSADEMLGQLRQRLENDRDTELAIAAAEQWKITRLRLENLFANARSHAA